jgi:hypothetical protein
LTYRANLAIKYQKKISVELELDEGIIKVIISIDKRERITVVSGVLRKINLIYIDLLI